MEQKRVSWRVFNPDVEVDRQKIPIAADGTMSIAGFGLSCKSRMQSAAAAFATTVAGPRTQRRPLCRVQSGQNQQIPREIRHGAGQPQARERAKPLIIGHVRAIAIWHRGLRSGAFSRAMGQQGGSDRCPFRRKIIGCGRARRSARVFWSSCRPWSGRSPGSASPFCALTVAMDFDDGGIDHGVFHIRLV